jgi:hypothetical protein
VGVTFKIRGLDRVLKALDKRAKDYRDAVAAGVYMLGNEIMTDSKRRTPVDTGTLKGSGFVTQPEERGGWIVSTLGYGGPAKDYAVAQHEKTEYAHPEGGEAKFLENAANAFTGSGARIVRETALKVFGSSTSASKGPHPTDPEQGPRGKGRG